MEFRYPITNAVKQFIYKVYAWMGLALVITASVAYAIFKSPHLFHALFSSPFIVLCIFILQLALVVVLSLLIFKLSYFQAALAFLVYSLSMGLTMSAIFYTYSLQSLCITFITTAGMFSVMALYGYFTKANLTSVGHYSLMALFGLIISFIINIFLQSPTFDYFLSIAGIAIFTLLTAYDMQRIVKLGYSLSGEQEINDKYAIIGALTLYLDFINLFLMLLRFTGTRRE